MIVIVAAAFAARAESPGDPARFAQTLPGDIKWASAPTLRPDGKVAVIYGDPRKPGLFVTRVKLPNDFRIEPHTHPDERLYTVISGTFYIGFGDKFDASRLKAFPPGAAFVVPANASHFHWMRSGESVVQITGTGPSSTDYVDRADDPRK
ncbi:MAG: cupin domain-containing protein [Bacillota bacterium]